MSQFLGQNFLANKAKLRKIVAVLDLKPDDLLVEIGPGHGELTQEIIAGFRNLGISKFRIVAVEKDKKLAESLSRKKLVSTEIVEADVLKVLEKICSGLPNRGFKLVGNIPYYLTGYLFRILSGLKNKPSVIVFTLQKEVGERIIGKNGMNLFAASVQFWAKPEIIELISKKDFRPMPKVDSVILKLTPNSSEEIIKSEDYYNFIKILFKQPRKTILNNIAVAPRAESKEGIVKKMKKLRINPNDRPKVLSLRQIRGLSTLF